MRTLVGVLIAVTAPGWMMFAEDLDPTFRSGSPPILRGPDGPVFSMAEGSDSTVIIAGDFVRVNGAQRNGIARLFEDGTLDPSFDPGAGPDGAIRSVVVGSDGSMVVAGDFSNWGRVSTGGHLVRLKRDGLLDGEFVGGPAVSGSLRQVLGLADGSFLVLGVESEGGETRVLLQHRGPDGTVDSTFNPVLAPGVAVNALAREPGGSVLVAGRFSEFDGQPVTNLLRLRADLTLDSGFQSERAAAAGELFCVAAATDGRIAIGGAVTNSPPSPPFPSATLDVLLPTGQIDPAFARTANPFLPTVTRVTFDRAGNLLVADAAPSPLTLMFFYRFSATGSLSNIGFAGHVRGSAPLARARGSVLWALDGVTNEGDDAWNWLLETLPDGTINPLFNPVSSPLGELPWPVITLALLPDGDVVAPGPSGVRTNLTTGAIAFQRDLVRLNSSGAAQPEFQASATSLAVSFHDLMATEDGGIFVAGGFSAVNWDAQSQLMALIDEDGAVDPRFRAGLKADSFTHQSTVNHAARLGDGRVFAAGNFVVPAAVGLGETTLLGRFRPDGSRDPDFKFVTVQRSRSSAAIYDFAVLDPDRLLLWGRLAEFGPASLFGYSARGESNAGPVLEGGPDSPLRISDLVPQRDGRILVAGGFARVGGVPRRNLARLLQDLSVDPTFDPGTGPDGPVTAVAELSDGRVLVAGSFTHWNGQSLRRLALLREDGSVDPAFDFGSGPDDIVHVLTEQPDGRVLAGGRFGSFDGIGSPRLVRLQVPAVTPPVPAQLLTQPVTTVSTNRLAPLTLHAGGIGTPPLRWQWFRNGSPLAASAGFRGVASPELVLPPGGMGEAATYQVEISNASGRERSRAVVAGLASGTMEVGFTTNSATGGLRMGGFAPGSPGDAIAVLVADRDDAGHVRRVLIGGAFGLYDGVTVPGLVVVQPDGSRDATWNPPDGVTAKDTVAAAFRPDGRLVLAGRFSRLRGAPRDAVLQLKADGSLDEAFDPGDEMAVTPPPGFPKQTVVAGMALDGEGVFVASAAGAGAPNGFLRRLDGRGKTDLSFVATNAAFFGTPTRLSVEPRADGGVLVGGTQFAAQMRKGTQILFRGLARFLRDGSLDTNFNAKPRRPDNSAVGDVNAVIPLEDGHAWVAGTFAEFDRGPGPLVWLDSAGIADTNFLVRIPSDPPVRFPGKNLLGMVALDDGDWLLNYRPPVAGVDSIVRMQADGTVAPTSGGVVDTLRNAGPVVALGDGSYLTPITVKSSFPLRSSPVVGRFWLTDLSATPSATLPPVLLLGLESVTITNRPGFREPLVLSVAVLAGGEVRYRWHFNDTPLDSVTGPTLRVENPQPGVTDGRYRVEISNAAGQVTAEALVGVVTAPAAAPQLTGRWIGGPRPLRLQFQPAEGRTYRLEASDTLVAWFTVDDPDAVVGPGEFAPLLDNNPRYFRVVEQP